MSYNNYPLYKYYYKPDIEKIYELSKNIKNKFVFNKPIEIKQMINKTNINVFNPYSEQRKYNYVLLEDNYEDNIELNYLTDYFTLEERIKANIDIFDFDISSEDIKKIDELNVNEDISGVPANTTYLDV